ncbi:LysR family transcriptional regulator [Robbsia andropogonis]|uniref:LysR family transcriptional regulator n=1 Tax=Robbsia andropogonis TaxID=28092 RepID=A0A0F5JZA6_9BURK|nr:LysR family transcriptional regulator [Robbsia andropogonis]KKB62959.1 LysR family transcriptional regulator [Robbsia andropogonis]MCP1120281.1 LysR family transcriptional regulator [Robbsia andropogonis]MCP1130151.1 LysR family transcriptional regulator [Robbsia andropogonis]
MLELEDMRLFRALGSAKSLAEAARLLNLTPPAVTTRLQRIEERLGVRLGTREARGFSLTNEGQRLRQEAVDILERIDAIGAVVSGRSNSVSGNLRVVAPFGFGRMHIAPVMQEMNRSHPNLSVSLILSESPLAAAAGADIVISIGNTKPSSWVGHYLAPNERFLCASPKYAQRLSRLEHPSDLVHYDFLALRENDEDVTRLRLSRGGRDGRQAEKPVNIRLTGRLSSNDGTVICDWGIKGLGIFARSEWESAQFISSGKLVRVLSDWRLESAPIMALTPTRTGLTPRQKAFLDIAKERLGSAPWRK